MPSNINARYVVNGDDILLDTNAIVRRTEGLKTPDTIVAATAIVHGLPLVTADKRFSRVVDLRVIADILE